MTTAQYRILDLLQVSKCPLSGAQIASITGLGSGRLYMALHFLEYSKDITGEWEETHKEGTTTYRRRMYQLTKKEK